MMKKTSLLILCGFLSGCSFFMEREDPLPLYTLKSQIFSPVSTLNAPLSIDLPLSEVSLNTARIAVTPSPYERDYMANGQWPDRLPKVVQEVLLESLSERWGGNFVNRSTANLQTVYGLTTDIQDFSIYGLETEFPEVRTKVMFKLIDFRNRQVLASQTFSEKTPVTSVSMGEIIKAFNHSLQNILKKAVPWMEGVFLKKTNKSTT